VLGEIVFVCLCFLRLWSSCHLFVESFLFVCMDVINLVVQVAMVVVFLVATVVLDLWMLLM
jgi:hypothetical protein